MHIELKSGVYRHFKGGLYLMLGLARHSETDEKFVAYVPLSVRSGPRITVRPYELFVDEVTRDGVTQPRFIYVGEEVSKDMAKAQQSLAK